MQVLKYKRFVSEKLGITPMSKERLKKESDLLHIDNFWKGKEVVGCASFTRNLMNAGFSRECWENIGAALVDTKRKFISWEKLPMDMQAERHKQYLGKKKKIRKSRALAALYVALDKYSKNNEYARIIRDYADNVQTDLYIDNDLLVKLLYNE